MLYVLALKSALGNLYHTPGQGSFTSVLKEQLKPLTALPVSDPMVTVVDIAKQNLSF
jgi:hypothetical protein